MSTRSIDPQADSGTSAQENGHDFDHIDVPEGQEGPEGRALGKRGLPLNRRSPYFIGLMAALGVLSAIVVFRMLAEIGTVLELVGISLFLAVGLDPAVVWLTRHRFPRWLAVIAVVLVAFSFLALFAVAAVGPITREAHQVQRSIPKWKADAESGRGWLGRLVKDLHLKSDITSGKFTTKINASTIAGGVVGAGKVVISTVTAVAVVGVLTIYFLVAFPAVRALWLRFMPSSRRTRIAALSDEIFSRVGGFVLGNLLTSIVAGVGTWVWLTIFGVPYPLLLGLLVALLDLIPIVGSTIGGIIVAAVALSVSLPVALLTLGFYIAYRFFEDYLLTPRVMRHTVRISPGITIIATLVGGVLLGLIGALIAIPLAAAIRLVLEEVTFPSLDER